MIFKNGKAIYNRIENSSAMGDKDIDSDTIFAIYSMSKVTTVAVMILLDRELYNLDDNLSKYLNLMELLLLRESMVGLVKITLIFG